jgi:hypothetical protein
MKPQKYFAIATILLAITTNLKAQDNGKSIRMGFLLSPQVSWLSTDNENAESSGSRFGYNFGLMFDRFFAPNYAFTTGLTINKNGGSITYMPSTPDAKKDVYNLSYLEIPLAIKLKSSDTHRVVFNGQFGLSNQINVEARNADGKSIASDVKLFNFGYHIGAGIEHGLGGNTALMFGIIYHNGLTDVTNDDDKFTDKAELHRIVFQMGIIF